MRRALALAENGLFTTTPNPRVGCVITQGESVVGEGWHERAGELHAEAIALSRAGEAARGATVYVNLEPCSHYGRTPPCAQALIDAKVARVVAALRDPDPQAARGGDALAAAGVRFEHGLLEAEARELNLGFLSRVQRGRPWVRLKVAATLDGRSALASGASQWITGPEARRDGHRWRARACALLTGIGTVTADDPRLTVREVETPRQPLRVIVDSRLEIPPEAQILRGAKVLIFAARAAPAPQNAEVVVLPNAHGQMTLPRLLEELARRHARDDFDLPALRELLASIERREVRVVSVETQRASPFASSLLFDYIASYMYEGDAPLADRRAQALTLDRDLLRELLGAEELRELFDADALEELELELQALTTDPVKVVVQSEEA